MSQSGKSGVGVVTEPIEHLNIEALAFHPLVKARLDKMLARAQAELEGCKVEAFSAAQSEVRTIRAVLGLPAKLLSEERAKAGE